MKEYYIKWIAELKEEWNSLENKEGLTWQEFKTTGLSWIRWHLNMGAAPDDIDVTSLKTKSEQKREKTPPALVINNYQQNVEEFYERQPFFYDKSKIFWMWNKKKFKWEIVDDVDIMNRIDIELGFAGQTVTSGLKINYMEAFKRVGRNNIPKNAKKKWIQFKNEAFSLKSKKIHKVTPDFFFCNPIPFEIGEIDKTPVIDKLFEEWVGKEYVSTLYEIIAYCCYSDYPIQVLFCLYGSGRNGKTCFLRLLSKFIGLDNLCSTDLDLIAGTNSSRFEIFKLYKKLACLMGETNFGILNSSSVLKKITGSDLIGFEKKGKDPFDEYSYAKVLIASNSLPSSEDTSEGFYRRWIIIDFPNQFPEGKDVLATIPKQEYNNLAKKVCNILVNLIEKGEFTNQGTIKERRDKYIMASNPLPFFVKHKCIVDVERYIRYSEFYAVYNKYLKKINRRLVSRKEFSKSLNNEGYENRKTSKDGVVDYYVEGIGFKENIMDFSGNNDDSSGNLLDLPDFRKSTTNSISIEPTYNLEKSSKSGKSPEEMHNNPEVIHHKCQNCKSTPCIDYYKGKPICKHCLETINISEIVR